MTEIRFRAGRKRISNLSALWAALPALKHFILSQAATKGKHSANRKNFA